MSMSEEVLCLPTKSVWGDQSNASQVMIRDIGNGAEFFGSINDQMRFIIREDCEEDENWQQIIPYVVICRDRRVLLYDRGSKGGESRLSGKLSVGIGGHVNVDDQFGSSVLIDVIQSGLVREVCEETNVPGVAAIHSGMFLIRETETAVGRVHTGVVTSIFPSALRYYGHTECESAWVNPSMIIDHPRLETWSKIALKLLFPELNNAS